MSLAMNPWRRLKASARVSFVCLFLSLFPCSSALTQQAPEHHWGRDRSVDIEHVLIDVAIDLKAGTVKGTTTLTVKGIVDGTSEAKLDAVDFDIESVKVNGREAEIDYDGTDLSVLLEPPLDSGRSAEIVVSYAVSPQTGLYFVRPDKGYPNKPLQCWSQGETEDNQRWFPVIDYPNERMSTETKITVEDPLQVVSNGRFLGKESNGDGTSTWHHHMDFQHVAYLVSLAIGDFATVEESWGDVGLSYHVPRGREDDIERSFANTAAILEFIADHTGMPYPYSVYRQTVVADFIFGGMENITATTLVESTLHDERAHSDWRSEGLVAHEAAHQWFGDYLTCADWEDTWLNEGFATYYGTLSAAALISEDDIVVAFDGLRKSAISADEGEKRRPIVTSSYVEPFDLFDGHSYAKGAMVLHALERELGEAAFRKAVNHYLTSHAARSVKTHDLVDAIEESTGRDVSQFFAQWLHGAGQPELELSWSWSKGDLEVTVEQVQARSELVGLFDVPLDLQVLGDDLRLDHAVRISDAKEIFHFQVDERPRAVVADPGGNLLRKLDIKRRTRELAWVVENATMILPRIEAARDLSKKVDVDRAVKALGGVLADSGNHWALRKAAARSLGSGRGANCREPLLKALTEDEDSRVRSEAAEALGEFTHKSVVSALKLALSSDDSYAVRGKAATSLGKIGATGAERVLERALRQRSHRETVFKGALDGLYEMDAPGLRATCERWSAYGKPPRARNHAISMLAKMAVEEEDAAFTKDVLEGLIKHLDDPLFWTRNTAMEALATLGEPGGVGPLQRMADTSAISRGRGTARRALKKLNKALDEKKGQRSVRKALADEKEAREALARRVESLEVKADEDMDAEVKGGE